MESGYDDGRSKTKIGNDIKIWIEKKISLYLKIILKINIL